MSNKLRILKEVQQILSVKNENMDKIPQIVTRLLQVATTPPCLVAFAFEPSTGMLRQVATSPVPQTFDAYSLLSRQTANLAQQFQQIAREVMQNVAQKGGVDGSTNQRQDDEPGTGDGADRPEVGQVPAGSAAPSDVGE